MLGLLFAQFMTAVHACSLAFPAAEAPLPTVQLSSENMAPDCPLMAKRVATNAKVCEGHCTYDKQIDVYPDAPTAAIAPHPALLVRIALATEQPRFRTTFLEARSTAPPVSLLFSRFLI
jgi:hypothetical protein